VSELDDVRAYARAVLTGERVRLRSLREADVACLVGWYTDPAFMVTNGARVLPQSEAAVRARFAEWSANEHDDLGFAIETRDDPPVLVGHIGLFGARPKDRCATIGLGLGLEHGGRGYGTDAVRVVTSYGFRELGLHRVQLEVYAFNTAGIRAYTKAGFVEEGRRRDVVFHDGRWHDEVLMSVLETEWAALRPPPAASDGWPGRVTDGQGQ
jgi:RimJ/RimL family protein N-acetyltransferase